MQIQKRLTTYSNCEFFPELIVITDGTGNQFLDQKIVPKKTHYSGKMKKHTVKNQITINLKMK